MHSGCLLGQECEGPSSHESGDYRRKAEAAAAEAA